MSSGHHYDNGWEDAIEDGHLFAENWLLDPAASGLHGPYSSRRGGLADEHYGKNEPEDPYFS